MDSKLRVFLSHAVNIQNGCLTFRHIDSKDTYQNNDKIEANNSMPLMLMSFRKVTLK